MLIAEEDEERARFGPWMHYGINQHSIKDFQLPAVTNCCSEIRNGTEWGSNFGILIEVPKSDNFMLGIRAGYYSKSGFFEAKYNSSVFIDGFERILSVEQNLRANLENISFEPYLNYELFNDFYLSLGFRFGYFITKNYKYSHNSTPNYEEIIGQNIRNSSILGNVDDNDASLNFGISYEIPLNSNKTFMLVPEIIYETGLMNICEDCNWKINTLRGGISLKISPETSRKIFKEEFIYDTLIVFRDDADEEYLKQGIPKIKEFQLKEKNITYIINEITRTDTLVKPVQKTPQNDLYTEISAYGKMPWGEIKKVNNILAKVQMTKEIYPLLNFVFFKKGESSLSMEYKDNSFDLTSYYPNPLSYHLNVLNIIADRMLKSPATNIALTGYIDETTEGNNCELAVKRAEAVKEYMVENCNIPEDRIIVKQNLSNCYPKNLTKANNEDRYAENRMVEITCDNLNILAPIAGDWYQKPQIVAPVQIYFDVVGSSLDKFESWNFKLFQDNLVLKELFGKEKQTVFEHKITDEEAYFFTSETPLTAEYVGYNDIGEYSSTNKSLRVLIDTSDNELVSVNLILFGVSDFNISEITAKQIKSFVSGLDENDKLYIYGYTDILGNDDLNKNLAISRAYNIASFINEINPDLKIEGVAGIATNRFAPGISSYNSPGERFLCRSVEIRVLRNRD